VNNKIKTGAPAAAHGAALIAAFAVTLAIALSAAFAAALAGCASSPAAETGAGAGAQPATAVFDLAAEMVPLGSAAAVFDATPVASATRTNVNEWARVDYSNAADGYIMVKYEKNQKKAVKAVVSGAAGAQYTYNIRPGGRYEVFPLSDGNGRYTVSVCEQIEGDRYAVVSSTVVDVTLKDEFAPFLRPNQFVNYTRDGATARKASELTAQSADHVAKIGAVYNYVVNNITYDIEQAKNLKDDYLPDLDVILNSGKGICFDFAAMMTAMLRSIGIPTKLVFGNAGGVYHAWIDTYSDEEGWIENTIFFDGESWKSMDPTLAATGADSRELAAFIGSGVNYSVKYLY
jgi:hypothetical protein